MTKGALLRGVRGKALACGKRQLVPGIGFEAGAIFTHGIGDAALAFVDRGEAESAWLSKEFRASAA